MPTPIDRDKLLSVGYLSQGRTRNKVTEGKDKTGESFKAVTDELNNTVIERAERQDVVVTPQSVEYKLKGPTG